MRGGAAPERGSACARACRAALPVARVVNKIDLRGEAAAGAATRAASRDPRVSAKTGAGIEALRGWLLEMAGWRPHGEGLFMARERHLVALREARPGTWKRPQDTRKPLNYKQKSFGWRSKPWAGSPAK